MAKKKTEVEVLTKGYEEFIKTKQVKKTSGKEFQRTLKKAATTKKGRGSK